MEIKTFIEKAIEGGWSWTPAVENYPKDLKLKVFHASYHGDFVELINNRAILSPLAWQAVGKVEGKEKEYIRFTIWRDTLDGEVKTLWWLAQMHRMIDALAEGKTIEEFLQSL